MTDEPTFIDAIRAAAIANRFLEERGSDGGGVVPRHTSLGGRYYKYLTSNDSTVYEFSVTRGDTQAGYILISGTLDLPPVLGYCPTGKPLRSILTQCVEDFIRLRNLLPTSVEWRYFGPFDHVAEIKLAGGDYCYARFPNYLVTQSKSRIVHPPRMEWVDVAWINDRWEYYSRDDRPKVVRPLGIINGCRPYKYQQTCQSSLEEGGPDPHHIGLNYCSPSCIAGCTPTSWAILASAFKGLQNIASIFNDAPDWNIDWPTNGVGGHPLPASQAVNGRIWELRNYMQTDCQGGTDFGVHLLFGSYVFSQYDVNWEWRWTAGPGAIGAYWEVQRQIETYGRPVSLSANSNWQSGQPRDGHSVVAYGCNDGERQVFVCYGWGSDFADAWIPCSIMGGMEVCYVYSYVESD
jgi:hypothetical protein